VSHSSRWCNRSRYRPFVGNTFSLFSQVCLPETTPDKQHNGRDILFQKICSLYSHPNRTCDSSLYPLWKYMARTLQRAYSDCPLRVVYVCSS
jgi:hypothetical protein